MSNADVAVVQLERTSVSPTRESIRWGFLPAMVGLMAVGSWLAGSGAAKWQLMAVLLVAIGFSFAAERIAPYETSWNSPRGDGGRDLAHTLVNEGLQLVSLVSLPVLVNLIGFEGVWPDDWSFWIQVLVSVVVLDAGLTLGHWWSHRWSPLWRLHAVHHSVQRFYGLNGLMKHPLHQLFETGVATAPLVLIGLPAEVASALVVCVGVQLLVQHSNVDYHADAVRWLVAVNELHRFHHLKWPGVGDANFGLFFTVWDRLLGTYVWDPSSRFASDVLGIAAEPDFPVAYVEQLVRPFKPYTPVHTDIPAAWRS